MAEFYRIGLGATLPGASWGRYASTRLDAAQRVKELSALGQMALNQEDWGHYEKARVELWSMLGHESVLARTAARYAIAGCPDYLIGLENRMVESLIGPPSPLRLETAALAAMVEPGFLPAVDAALASKDFSAVPEEEKFLNLRRDAAERGVWKP